MDTMKGLAIAMAIGSAIACGGPTAPTAVAPANIAGSYDLSIGASSSCSANLPVETRVLNYVANVSQAGATFNVQLLAHVTWNNVAVTGTVSGQAVTFSTFSFSENDTGGGVALTTTGTATVSGDGLITGTLSGAYQTPSGSNCNAANHQLHM